jgi:hypothetical protein
MTNFRRLAALSFMLALLVVSAFASDDPPSRAVRIKYISGPVSIQPGGVNDWTEAVVNRPLTTSDRVWTDKDARAELHLGSAALRMNAETSMTLTNLSDDIVQVELDQGTLNIHIRHLFGGETYEIDTPNQAFTILKAGDYRFDVDPNADTTSVTVWRGEGEANGQGQGVRLRSGHQASFTGGTSLEHQLSSAPGLDGFDDWCRVRDDREDHARSYQYVSADVVGADDLDDYGTWRTVPTYGAVWVPAVAPGWAPYRHGRWVWVEPWGWTWVDEAPWGFAPCHYGRWVHYGGYWAWAPGPVVVARPVYAPALVAWVGGPHLSLSVSFGGGSGVAWFPLGWGEPYVPSYRASRNYFQQVNVTNTRITNITNVTNNYYVVNNNTTIVKNTNIHNIRYVNQHVEGAVTAVPARALTNSESVSRSAVAVSAHEMRTATVVNTASVAPGRASVLGRSGSPSMIPPAHVASARPVFSRMAPPEKPVPFEVKQEALARTPGRPLDRQTEIDLRSKMARPAPPVTQPVPQAAGNERRGRPSPSPDGTPANAARGPMNPVTRMPQPLSANPGRVVPRPSQPGREMPEAVATTPATPARPSTPAAVNTTPAGSERPSAPAAAMPASRPVPRPPVMERTSGPASPESGRNPSPQPAEMRRPAAAPNPPMQPRPSAPSVEAPRPSPRPTESEGRPGMDRPTQPSAPRPIQREARPIVERPAQQSAPRQVQQAAPRPTRSEARMQNESRPNPRPRNEARPQRQEQREKSQPKHEEKQRNNLR